MSEVASDGSRLTETIVIPAAAAAAGQIGFGAVDAEVDQEGFACLEEVVVAFGCAFRQYLSGGAETLKVLGLEPLDQVVVACFEMLET